MTGSVSSVRQWFLEDIDPWSAFCDLCSHVPNILDNSDPYLSPSIFYVVDQNWCCKSICKWHQSKLEFANVCSNKDRGKYLEVCKSWRWVIMFFMNADEMVDMIEMIKANNWLRNVNRPRMIEMKDMIYRSRSLDFQKSEVRRKTRQFPIWQSNLTSE